MDTHSQIYVGRGASTQIQYQQQVCEGPADWYLDTTRSEFGLSTIISLFRLWTMRAVSVIGQVAACLNECTHILPVLGRYCGIFNTHLGFHIGPLDLLVGRL